MKIYADDGKEFKSVDECNAYEADLKLQKEKERVERKAKLEKADTLQKEIDDLAKKLTEKVNEYETLTSKAMCFYTMNGELKVRTMPPYKSLLDGAFRLW
jgi:hypothetical protein